MKNMDQFFKSLLVMWLALGLTACSVFSSDEDDVNQPVPLTDFSAETELKVVWTQSVGDGAEDRFEQLVPSVSGDVIYGVDARGRVVALDREIGSTLWDRSLETQVGAGVNADEDLLLLGTLDGQVIALNPNDGSELWKTRVNSEVLSSPQVDGATVIVQTIDDTITALSTKTGEVLWTQENIQPALTLRGSSTPLIADDVVFAGLSSGEAKAFRVDDGTQLWSSRLAIPEGTSELERMIDIKAAPLMVGNQLFMVSFQGNVVSLDKYSGRILWSRKLSSYKSMTEGFGSLYLTDENSYVAAVDQRSGAVNWRQEQLGHRNLSAPTTFSSYVVVADFEGYVHLLSQVDGSVAGRLKAGSSAIKAKPLVIGGNIYVLDVSGKLRAIVQK